MGIFKPPAIIITSLAFICAALCVAGLRYGLSKSPLPLDTQKRSVTSVTLAIVAWVVLAGILAKIGFFSRFDVLPPRLLLAILLPGLALAVVTLTSRTLPAALRHTPVAWLIYLQTFRIIVEIVLWRAYKVGAVPVQMTFEGRNYDILAGLTAPIAGWIWQRTRSRVLATLWNIAGLGLLLNIIVVAILSMPTPLRVFREGPTNTLLTHFPFIYLPAILVPIAYIAHTLSLRQLFSRRLGDDPR